MRALALTALLAATPAAGQSFAVAGWPFIELGLALPTAGCIADGSAGCSDRPLGIVVLGWQINDRLAVQWEHLSSVREKDRGLDLVSVRSRFSFRRP